MLNINDIEKKIILELHNNHKQNLREQQKPQEIDLITNPLTIATNIQESAICFCKTSRCGAPYKDPKTGDILINATAASASQSIDETGNKRYDANDSLIFNISKFTYTVEKNGKRYSWGCQALTPTITNMRNAIVKYYDQMGYKNPESFEYNPDLNDTNKFDVINLSINYPYLFPVWEGIDKTKFILHKPKSSNVQPDVPVNSIEKSVVDAYKSRYPDLKTQQEVMDERNISDFSVVATYYEPVQIARIGDGKFNRPFFLYRLKAGQAPAKQMAQRAKESQEELNINKPTCSKLIKRFYEIFKLKDAAFTNLTEVEFNKLKQQVTYCSRKYDNYGVLGSDKIDDMLSQLKSLSSTNQFKIK